MSLVRSKNMLRKLTEAAPLAARTWLALSTEQRAELALHHARLAEYNSGFAPGPSLYKHYLDNPDQPGSPVLRADIKRALSGSSSPLVYPGDDLTERWRVAAKGKI